MLCMTKAFVARRQTGRFEGIPMADLVSVQHYYEHSDEDGRLRAADGEIEFLRTKDILQRYLPTGNLRIADVGGGSGPYSFWLSGLGHEVYLLDLVSKHVRIAIERNKNVKHRLASIEVGAADNLPFPDGYFDVVLLMGPLYHLPEATERNKALLEAKRVLKASGMIFSAHISRFASLLDGYRSNLIADPEFRAIVAEDLSSGRHRGSADGSIKYFTDAYLQRPEEIEAEALSAGFQPVDLLSVEGFGWLVPDFAELWKDEVRRADLLKALALVEKEKSLFGVSAHLMLVARKK
jgi:ubiquinone/menaquinone biosynthesis C-methylase UbiE